MAVVTMKSLLESGVHFGHQVKRWDPRMKKYIFAERNGIHIIDLQKTILSIKEAYEAVRKTTAAGKSVITSYSIHYTKLYECRAAGDWDVATDAPPESVMRLFRRVIPTGIAHGTVTIHHKGAMIECTTFRTETGYSDGRRPDSVAYAATIEEDLSRRDFTMNAIAVSLPDGEVVDPFNGRGDIKAGLIKTVGNAEERFGEDGLRPLRAVRFSAQLDFRLDDRTKDAIRPALGVTALVAKERVRDELSKLLRSPVPSTGLRIIV